MPSDDEIVHNVPDVHTEITVFAFSSTLRRIFKVDCDEVSPFGSTESATANCLCDCDDEVDEPLITVVVPVA